MRLPGEARGTVWYEGNIGSKQQWERRRFKMPARPGDIEFEFQWKENGQWRALDLAPPQRDAATDNAQGRVLLEAKVALTQVQIIGPGANLYLRWGALNQPGELPNTQMTERTVNLKVLNKAELGAFVQTIQSEVDDAVFNELVKLRGDRPFGKITSVNKIRDRTGWTAEPNALRLDFAWDVDNLLYQPVFSDCDCDVDCSMRVAWLVQPSGDYSVVALPIKRGDIRLQCPSGTCKLLNLFAALDRLTAMGRTVLPKTTLQAGTLKLSRGIDTRVQYELANAWRLPPASAIFLAIVNLKVQRIFIQANELWVTVNYKLMFESP
jgi:hypothetical protein